MHRRTFAAVAALAVASGVAVARAQDDTADAELAWSRNAVREACIERSVQGVPFFLVRVATPGPGGAAGPTLLVDLPGGGTVVAFGPGRETTLLRAAADPVRVAFGGSRVLHVAAYDRFDQKLFEGEVLRPAARVFLSVRPGWDDGRCARALSFQTVLARAVAGNEGALDQARGFRHRREDDAVVSILVAELRGRGPAEAPPAQPVKPRNAKEPCGEQDLVDFVASLKRVGFDDNRVDLVEGFAADHWFTVAQATRIARTCSFPSGMLRVLGLVAPRILDRDNFFKLYDLFAFETDREHLRRIEKGLPGDGGAPPAAPPAPPVDATPDATPVREAASEDDFRDLMARLRRASFDESKLKVLDSFVEGRWLNVDQLVQVVRGFSFSDGQIKAATAVWPRLVDRSNFYKVYDALAFETDKARLHALEKEWRERERAHERGRR